MSKFFCFFLLWVPMSTRAQDQQAETPPEPHRVQPAPLFAEGWSWTPSQGAHVPNAPILALSGLGGETGLLFTIDEEGGVWRSEDDGQRWRLRLPGYASQSDFGDEEESILLEAESLAEDLLGASIEDELDPDALDEEILEEAGRIQEQADTLVVEDWLASQAVDSGKVAKPLLWIHPNFPDLVLLSRGDGIWRSSDGGLKFEQVDRDLQLTQIGWSGGVLILGATPEGMAYTLDGGRSWIRKSDGASLLDCKDLIWTGTAWLLASGDGLYRSESGETWRLIKNGVAGMHVGALVNDIAAPGSGWLATETEVLRFEENGNRVLRFSRQNLNDVHTLISTARPSHVISAGSDGVWESGDGGFKWRPLSRGLQGPEVNGLLLLSRGLLLGSPQGLFELKKAVPRETVAVEVERVPLDVLVSKALRRQGMDPRNLGVRGALSAVRRFLPEVSLDGQLVRRSMIAADYFDLSNQADIDSDWRITVGLRWGKGGSGSDPASNESAGFGDLFYVLGDRLYSSDNPQALQSATSRLLVDSTDYRLEVRQRLSSLYFAHWRLVQQRPPDAVRDLRSAVLFQLDVQELTAWIDAYTDGSFSLALLGD
jgi:hypothetical protein